MIHDKDHIMEEEDDLEIYMKHLTQKPDKSLQKLQQDKVKIEKVKEKNLSFLVHRKPCYI
jgi:hypothetical protein